MHLLRYVGHFRFPFYKKALHYHNTTLKKISKKDYKLNDESPNLMMNYNNSFVPNILNVNLLLKIGKYCKGNYD